MHFTRDAHQTDMIPVTAKGEQVVPKNSAKVLGVIMDSELRFKEQVASAATKGLNTAMALKQLRMVSPSAARQLFGAAVSSDCRLCLHDIGSRHWEVSCRGA